MGDTAGDHGWEGRHVDAFIPIPTALVSFNWVIFFQGLRSPGSGDHLFLCPFKPMV